MGHVGKMISLFLKSQNTTQKTEAVPLVHVYLFAIFPLTFGLNILWVSELRTLGILLAI